MCPTTSNLPPNCLNRAFSIRLLPSIVPSVRRKKAGDPNGLIPGINSKWKIHCIQDYGYKNPLFWILQDVCVRVQWYISLLLIPQKIYTRESNNWKRFLRWRKILQMPIIEQKWALKTTDRRLQGWVTFWDTALLRYGWLL